MRRIGHCNGSTLHETTVSHFLPGTMLGGLHQLHPLPSRTFSFLTPSTISHLLLSHIFYYFLLLSPTFWGGFPGPTPPLTFPPYVKLSDGPAALTFHFQRSHFCEFDSAFPPHSVGSSPGVHRSSRKVMFQDEPRRISGGKVGEIEKSIHLIVSTGWSKDHNNRTYQMLPHTNSYFRCLYSYPDLLQ